jgi:hypothetical protein
MAARPLLPRSRSAMKSLIGGLLIAATLAVGTGCAKTDWIDRTLVTVDVTGTWSGSLHGVGTGSRELLLDLEQKGSTVKGSVQVSPAAGMMADVLDGTIAGDAFRFRDSRGRLEGNLTVSGDEMAGQVSLLGSTSQISFRRTEPASPPGSPPR